MTSRLIALILLLSIVLPARQAASSQNSLTGSPENTPAQALLTGSAQDGAAAPHRLPIDRRLRFEHFSSEDGLSQNAVFAMLQDRQGFLWIGTQDGLNRYDGQGFTIYRNDPQDVTSLSSSSILSLLEDSQGVLWVGTWGGGLNRFDPRLGQFTRYLPDPEDPQALGSGIISALLEDRQGRLWVATCGAGLHLLDRQSGTFTRYTSTPDDPQTLGSDNLSSLYEDAGGDLWAGSGCSSQPGNGLSRFDPETGTVVRYLPDLEHPEAPAEGLLGSPNVSSITADASGALWIGTGGYTLQGNGLYRLDPASGRFTAFRHDPQDPSSLGGNDVLDVWMDPTGILFVGLLGGGLDLLDTRQENGSFNHNLHDPYEASSLHGNDIQTFLVDRSGVYWVGSLNRGLHKLNPQVQVFRLYRSQPGNEQSLSSNATGPIIEDPQGKLWIGTWGGGAIDHFDPDTQVFSHYLPPANDPLFEQSRTVLSLHLDRQGVLWGGSMAGLFTLDPATSQFTFFRHDPNDPASLADNNVTAMIEDPSGRLWAGTFGGLDWFDPDLKTFGHAAIPELGAIFALHLDAQGNLWAGTWGSGLFKIRLESLLSEQPDYTRYTNDPDDPHSLANDTVITILEDQVGALWLGTEKGLDRFDPAAETFTHYQTQNGLPNNTVMCLAQDEQGLLWVSTNDGLARFDPALERFQVFHARDGLQGSEFDSGSCARLRSGELAFGGLNGLNLFDPQEIQPNLVPPPVALTALRVFNEPMPVDTSSSDPLQLSYQQNFISFEFAALDFHAPEKNTYAYQLEGFDKDWMQAGSRGYASYTNLPGGEYTFRVRAANNDGVWNETALALPLEIVPPFWQTPWFLAGMALLLVGAGVAGVRWRLGSVRAQNRRLEILVGQRTTELRQTNAQLQVEIEQRKRAEAALALRAAEQLQQSEARFRAMFESSAVGIGMITLERGIIDANPAMCQIFGYSLEEMKALDYATLVHPEDMGNDEQDYRQVIDGKKEYYHLEKRYLRKDGAYIWGRGTISAVRDGEGKARFLVGMIEDVTGRKQMQEELRQSEARFRSMFENAGVGMALVGLDRRPIALNEAMLRMTGYSHEELMQMAGGDIIYPPDNQVGQQEYAELLKGQRASYQMERRYMRKNGQVYWVRMNNSVVRDAEGQPLYLVTMVEDIDAQKQAQEELRISEARFRAMFENMAVGFGLMSLDRRVLKVNQYMIQLTGYPNDELLALNPTEFAHPEDRSKDRELYQELIMGKREQYQVEKRYIRKGGQVFWGRTTFTLVRETSGKPSYIIGMMEDIDEERRAQEMLAAQESEYRRTLEQRVEERTAELMAANLLLQDEIEKRREAESALAQKAADEAVAADRNRLARDLHDAVTQTLFSASLIAEVLPQIWETNPGEAFKRLAELRELTRGALAEMRTLLLELRPSALTDSALPDLLRQLTEAARGRARLPVTLTVDGECCLPSEVQVAFYRIAQEALNNIAKYAKASQVSLDLRMQPDQTRLTIMDNGAGFDLTRVPPNHLGLRIMRERAEAIGARFSIYSEPGEGTQVTAIWQPPG